MNELVSVIIPSYRRKYALLNAVKSVLEQDYSNVEVIVVLDSYSTTDIEYITNSLSGRDNVFFHVGEDLGGARARNIGMDMAKGYYWAFLDDDDCWLPTKLTDQVSTFPGKNNVSIVYSNQYLIHKETKRQKNCRRLDCTLEDLSYNNYIGGFSTVMIRRTEIRIDEHMLAMQDWQFWRAILKKSHGVAINTKKFHVEYYIHGGDKISSNFEKIRAGHERFLELNRKDFDNYLINFHEIRILKKKLKNQIDIKLLMKYLRLVLSSPLSFRGNVLLARILVRREFR